MHPSAPRSDESLARSRRAIDLFVELSELDAPTRDARLELLRSEDRLLSDEIAAMFAADASHDDALAPGAGISRVLGTRAGDRTGHSLADRPAPAPLAPPQLAGRYRLLRVIGEGGMGTVYEAEQAAPKRLVALKALRASGPASDRVIQRFALEAEVLARLQHPGIAQVYEAGFADDDAQGPAWIAMELVRGRPLVEAVRDSSVGLRGRLQLFLQVCDAVAYAHQRGVIHRDLKPANILLGEADDTAREAGLPGCPKVLDFGVARVVGDAWEVATALTSPGQIVGTLAYMSPEQLAGNPDGVDVRADVYALGVILYELLTDSRPFDIGSLGLADAIRHIREEPAPTVSEANPELRGDISAIVSRAMAKDARRRYQSVAALAEDIRSHLRGEPITARADSALYVLSRRMRRYRWPLAVASLLLLALVAFAIRATIEAERFEQVAIAAATAQSEAVSAKKALEREFAQSRLDQARLFALEGSVQAASTIAHAEHAERPSRGTRWALRELVARHPCIANASMGDGFAMGLAVVDDMRVAIPVDNQSLRLFDRQGEELACVELDGPPRPMGLLAGARPTLIVPLTTGAIHAFDADTLTPLGEIAHAADFPRWMAARGDRFAVANDSGLIEVFDGSGSRVWTGRDVRGACAIEWLDDDRIVVGSFSGTLGVHHVGEDRRVELPRHAGPVSAFGVDPRHDRFYSASDDRLIRAWRLSTLEASDEADGRNGRIQGLRLADNGDLIAAGWWGIDRWGGTLRDRHRVGAVHEGTSHLGRVDDVVAVVSPRHLTFWSTEPGGGTRVSGLVGRTACALAPDGGTVAFADGQGNVALADPRTGAIRQWLPSHRSRVRTIAFSDSGRLFASAGDDRELRVYRTDTWSLVGQRRMLDVMSSSSAAFSPDETSIAAIFSDRTARIIDLATMTDLAVLNLGRLQALSVTWSPDGNRLVTTARDNVVRLWSRDGAPLAAAQRPTAIWTAAFSTDGTRLAVGTWGRTIELFDPLTIDVLDELRGPAGLVTQIAWMPGEPLLLGSSADGVLRVWDVIERRVIFSFEPVASGDITACSIDRSGSLIAASGAGGEAFVWDIRRWDRWQGPTLPEP